MGSIVSRWGLEVDRRPVSAMSSRGTPFTRWVPFGMPRIPDKFLDCVFYLYPSEEDAEAGRNAGGTGFFISRKTQADPSRHFIFAVTNWHVACQAGCSVMRVMSKSGEMEVFPFGPEDWLFDPEGHDVAIQPTVPVTSETHDIAYIPIDEETIAVDPKYSPIGIGDDVFMVGRFVDHDGGDVNKPTVRFGNISRTPTPLLLPNGNK